MKEFHRLSAERGDWFYSLKGGRIFAQENEEGSYTLVLAEEYRSKGWQVIEEYPLGKGKAVDLACFRDGRKVAVEIETGKSDAGYNVKKCIQAGFDEVRTIRVKCL
ncbi:MAG: hypothetical protein JRJ75_11125 [Deltaproteobacteria bacterium]|nr:hypothetical protein [Deltaproteobacteria bacterium]